ncbi:MAG: lipid kinase YegS, partial [Pirellulaceae bacterium]
RDILMASTPSRFIRVVLNGKSAGNPQVRSAVSAVREAGHRVEVRVTWEYGDSVRYVAEAVKDGVDVIVAAGGDGTVNEVVTGMMATEEPVASALAIIPLGTANDFATGCGIPIGDPLAALQLAASGQAVAIDIGQANERYFVNVASGGFGAEVTTQTPPNLKKALGGAAYVVTGIATAAKMTPHRCTVTLPTGESREGAVFVLAVGNGRQAGGGQQLAPNAILNDGKLDLIAVHDVNLLSFGNLVNEWVSLGDASNQNVSYAQLESFRIECEEPLQVNLDGEPVREQVYEFRAIPKAIRLVLPKSGLPLVEEV